MIKIVKLTIALAMLLASMGVFAAVNINTADAVTIQSELKGIGPAKAQAIVAYRDANGSFKSVDDLTKVKGIGVKTIELNRGNIVLELPHDSK